MASSANLDASTRVPGVLYDDNFAIFVVKRGVEEELVEGKLARVIEVLEEITSTSSYIISDIPSTQYSGPNTKDDTLIVLDLTTDDDNDLEIIREQTVNELHRCGGYELPIPNGQSTHSMYPFALHDRFPLPWNYTVVNRQMILHSKACKSGLISVGTCSPCRDLVSNKQLVGIISRMENGVHENLQYPYHGFATLIEVVNRKNARINHLELRGLNQSRKLLVSARTLSYHKRFQISIASGEVERVDRLVATAIKQGWGIRTILVKYDAAANGLYHPKNYTERDDMRGLLLWRLGGNRIAHIAHRALGLPSLTVLRNQSIMPHIVPSPSIPRVEEVKVNVESVLEGVTELLTSNVQHVVLMLDEIATEKRIRWCHNTNKFLGICREHCHNISLDFTTEEDMEEIFRCLEDGEIHCAAEATIGALGILSNNHRMYPAPMQQKPLEVWGLRLMS
ncbi:hypothetical protein H0H93_006221 [Arthromyces matolae]|nr:hypothetical protein H0H93_006221 [Arthromyces matolae]